ncbi:MAG: hypothetical protein KY053_01275 [Candidatus Liptonbacteria bacterium]|nr:hypothetical protein [Candidatus Liptonbacteria bacterium]
MFFLDNNRKNRSGQLLVEGLVALSILTIVILGVVAILSRSFRQTRIVFETAIASNLAAEGAEVAKNIIDRNVWTNPFRPWNEGISEGKFSVNYNSESFGSYQDRFIRFNPQTGIYSSQDGVLTPFERVIEMSIISPNLVKIKSTVTWQIPGTPEREVSVEHNVLGWR